MLSSLASHLHITVPITASNALGNGSVCPWFDSHLQLW